MGRARLATHRLLPRVLRAVPAGLAGGRRADLLLRGPAAPQAPIAAGGAHGDWLQGKGPASEQPATAGRGDRQHLPPGPATTPVRTDRAPRTPPWAREGGRLEP